MGRLISYSSRAGSHNFVIKWVHNSDEMEAHWLEKTRHDGAHCFHDGAIVTSSENLTEIMTCCWEIREKRRNARRIMIMMHAKQRTRNVHLKRPINVAVAAFARRRLPACQMTDE